MSNKGTTDDVKKGTETSDQLIQENVLAALKMWISGEPAKTKSDSLGLYSLLYYFHRFHKEGKAYLKRTLARDKKLSKKLPTLSDEEYEQRIYEFVLAFVHHGFGPIVVLKGDDGEKRFPHSVTDISNDTTMFEGMQFEREQLQGFLTVRLLVKFFGDSSLSKAMVLWDVISQIWKFTQSPDQEGHELFHELILDAEDLILARPDLDTTSKMEVHLSAFSKSDELALYHFIAQGGIPYNFPRPSTVGTLKALLGILPADDENTDNDSFLALWLSNTPGAFDQISAMSRKEIVAIWAKLTAEASNLLTPLQLASWLSIPELVTHFCKMFPKDVNPAPSDTCFLSTLPPLILACFNAQNKSSVETLISAGADIRATWPVSDRETKTRTPLEVAIQFGSSVGVVRQLIDAGAKLTSMDLNGKLQLNDHRSEDFVASISRLFSAAAGYRNIDVDSPHFVIRMEEMKLKLQNSNSFPVGKRAFARVTINDLVAWETHMVIVEHGRNITWDSEVWVGQAKHGKSDQLSVETLTPSTFTVSVLVTDGGSCDDAIPGTPHKHKKLKHTLLGSVEFLGSHVLEGMDGWFPLDNSDAETAVSGKLYLKVIPHHFS